jgi:hypothetical protein
MVQRLQLLAWPDCGQSWKPQDRHPNSVARQTAFDCFERLSSITPESIGAQTEGLLSVLSVPYLRVSADGYEAFTDWRHGLEARVRSDDLAPAFAAHLSKYRGLVPRLALVSHLASGGTGPVSLLPMEAALLWAEYLEAHAARVFSSGSFDDVATAKAIWRRIIRGDVQAQFTPRDIYRNCWSGLADAERVEAGLGVLVEHGRLRRVIQRTGGRPTTIYLVNPEAAS